MTLTRLLLAGVVAVTFVAPLSTAAAGQTPKALVINAHNVTAESASGRDSKAVARPGDVIRYTLVFTNVQANAVKNVQFVDPIPQGLVYVLGSAAAGEPTRIEYSIDGGKTYSTQPLISVVEDGKKVEKPAPREMYTHVRWTVLSSVAPRAQVTAELRTQVKAAPGEAK